GTQLDETVRRFESEAKEKRREWESLQTSLRSQQAQFTTTSESRATELAKKTEELEGRDRSQRAAFAQLEMDRSKLDAEAKAQAAKSAEAEAAWRRSEARLAELKTKEDELLRGRQSFESERSTWAARRTEELKQHDATREGGLGPRSRADLRVFGSTDDPPKGLGVPNGGSGSEDGASVDEGTGLGDRTPASGQPHGGPHEEGA